MVRLYGYSKMLKLRRGEKSRSEKVPIVLNDEQDHLHLVERNKTQQRYNLHRLNRRRLILKDTVVLSKRKKFYGSFCILLILLIGLFGYLPKFLDVTSNSLLEFSTSSMEFFDVIIAADNPQKDKISVTNIVNKNGDQDELHAHVVASIDTSETVSASTGGAGENDQDKELSPSSINDESKVTMAAPKHDIRTTKIFDDDYPRLPKKTIAYAFSFIKCEGARESASGLIDSILILRHSIHKISSRNPDSGSNYDYKIFVIVHRMAEECSRVLGDLGFEMIVVDEPIKANEIEGELRHHHFRRELCCGHHEFVKLYAYKLPAEIIVHVDIDFAFFKPMDNLFDAMLEDKDSPKGITAREMIPLDYGNITLPGNDPQSTDRGNVTIPDKIGAFITRDWHQTSLGRWPSPFQGGFIIARRDPGVFDEISGVIRKGDYTGGFGWHSGEFEIGIEPYQFAPLTWHQYSCGMSI